MSGPDRLDPVAAARLGRMLAAYGELLGNVSIAGRREGDEEAVDRCSQVINEEAAAFQAERRENGTP